MVVFYLFQNGKDNFIGAKVVFPMNDQLCEETVKMLSLHACFLLSRLFASFVCCCLFDVSSCTVVAPFILPH